MTGSLIAMGVCLLVYFVPVVHDHLFNITILSAFCAYIGQLYGFIMLRTRFASLPRKFCSPLGISGAVLGMAIFLLGFVSVVAFQEDNCTALITLVCIGGGVSVYYFAVARKRQKFSKDELKVTFIAHVMKLDNLTNSKRISQSLDRMRASTLDLKEKKKTKKKKKKMKLAVDERERNPSSMSLHQALIKAVTFISPHRRQDYEEGVEEGEEEENEGPSGVSGRAAEAGGWTGAGVVVRKVEHSDADGSKGGSKGGSTRHQPQPPDDGQQPGDERPFADDKHPPLSLPLPLPLPLSLPLPLPLSLPLPLPLPLPLSVPSTAATGPSASGSDPLGRDLGALFSSFHSQPDGAASSLRHSLTPSLHDPADTGDTPSHDVSRVVIVSHAGPLPPVLSPNAHALLTDIPALATAAGIGHVSGRGVSVGITNGAGSGAGTGAGTGACTGASTGIGAGAGAVAGAGAGAGADAGPRVRNGDSGEGLTGRSSGHSLARHRRPGHYEI